ncbi:MAG TPA: hypothetical protein IAD47_07205 [Candidatus Limihabitans stercoravium]|nr:hypothetical protein [Candidatus Limihabitans stercoravium]
MKKRQKKAPSLYPFVVPTDNYTESQLKYITKRVALFGSLISIMILATFAFVAFIVVTLGLHLVLDGHRGAVVGISLALWTVVLVCAFISTFVYINLKRVVKHIRQNNYDFDVEKHRKNSKCN